MNIRFKITSALLASIRIDLRRPHAFAHERVGFISAGMSAVGGELLVLTRAYRPVLDGDYLPDSTVGAMMGPEAQGPAMGHAEPRRGVPCPYAWRPRHPGV
jgi:hypothetical protein